MNRPVAMAALLLLTGCSPFHEPLRTMTPVTALAPELAVPAKGTAKPVWKLAGKAFAGDVVNGRFHGRGQCAELGSDGKWTPYEPCEYLNGFRIDATWAARVLEQEARADRSNADYWADRRQQEQWRAEYQARKQAEYEQRQERRMEQAISATGAALRGDYSQAANAGLMGASTLQMAQASSEQTRALQEQLQRSQNASAEQKRLVEQQLLLAQRAQARAPAVAASGSTSASAPAPVAVAASTATPAVAPAGASRNPVDDDEHNVGYFFCLYDGTQGNQGYDSAGNKVPDLRLVSSIFALRRDWTGRQEPWPDIQGAWLSYLKRNFAGTLNMRAQEVGNLCHRQSPLGKAQLEKLRSERVNDPKWLNSVVVREVNWRYGN